MIARIELMEMRDTFDQPGEIVVILQKVMFTAFSFSSNIYS